MKWSKKQPKVSGYYWVRLQDPLRAEGGYIAPTIVKVYIRKDDPEWPDEEVWYFGNDIMGSILPNALWAGPIKLPQDPEVQLTKKVYKLYKEKGQYAVYDYARAHPEQFLPDWTSCEPCEDTTPSFKDATCAVCGSAKTDLTP